MLLSTSELFFVGLVHGTLAAPSLDPPNDPEYASPYDQDAPATLYGGFMAHVEICGLQTTQAVRENEDGDVSPPLDDMRWARGGELLDPAELAAARSSLIAAADDARRRLWQGESGGSGVGRFDELLEEDSPVAFGYSLSTPGVIYGLKKSGRVAVVKRVAPIPEGIVRIVLQLLARHLDMSDEIYMALAASGHRIPGWRDDWIPSFLTMKAPLEGVDCQAAVDAIERELIGAGREEPAWQLGKSIGRAWELLNGTAEWLSYELALIQQQSLATWVRDFKPLEDYGAERRSASEQGESEDIDGPAAGDEWTAMIMAAERAAVAQARIGVKEMAAISAHEGLLRHVSQSLRSLQAAKELAVQLGIDTIIPILNEGAGYAASLMDEAGLHHRNGVGARVKLQQCNRERLLSYPEKLRSAISLAFGELRLRDLVLDENLQAFAPSAQGGWMKLSENARHAVRDGLWMLKNGLAPYTVINAVAPVREAVVKALTAKHLRAFRGTDVKDMLYALLQHGKDNTDEDLQVAASIGMSLRLPRNKAAHDDEGDYDRHDAIFFLHGLAIMLRALQ